MDGLYEGNRESVLLWVAKIVRTSLKFMEINPRDMPMFSITNMIRKVEHAIVEQGFGFRKQLDEIGSREGNEGSDGLDDATKKFFNLVKEAEKRVVSGL
ncbi:hypothetical protein RJ639_023380 [Escallonia herrerae]|uniref:Uncharacterized protein n=1 Tax=Escallonia herrerae TaxID=1293975 RepID=A0AA88V1W8_9ASTE|nr:hypothetical protein RJ639_023380 [Escallonia herrerae]